MIIDEDISRELAAGDFYLINTKSLHTLIETDLANVCLIIQMNDSFVKDSDSKNMDYHFYLDSQNLSALPACGNLYFIRQTARLGVESLIKKPQTSHRVLQLLNGLVADLYDYCIFDTRASGLSNNTGKDMLERILNYIQNHFQHPDVLNEICRLEGLSDKSLYYNLLRQNINMTPSQFLTTIRLEHAKYLLACTQNLSVLLQMTVVSDLKVPFSVFSNRKPGSLLFSIGSKKCLFKKMTSCRTTFLIIRSKHSSCLPTMPPLIMTQERIFPEYEMYEKTTAFLYRARQRACPANDAGGKSLSYVRESDP